MTLGSKPPIFARFAITRVRSWVEPVPGGVPNHPWLFLINGGFASGCVEVSLAGVGFAPRRFSRLRGMGHGFIPWALVREIDVVSRDGAFGANFMIMRLHGGDTITISTFSLSKLTAALHAIEKKIPDFPEIVT